MQHIFERMVHVRGLFRMTQKDFASLLGVTENTIRNYENDGRTKPGFDELKKILDYDKKISAQWLINGEGDVYKKESNLSSAHEDTMRTLMRSVELLHTKLDKMEDCFELFKDKTKKRRGQLRMIWKKPGL